MKPDFPAITRHFRIEGLFLQAHPYGTGHINDTYVTSFQQPSAQVRRYLLQRINHHVFADPEGLMENMALVLAHLRAKIIAVGGEPNREVMTLIPTVEGNTFARINGQNYWRALVLIEGARTYEAVESLDQVYQAARAFGSFLKLLVDFPAEALHETIPDFHHTRKRFDAFVQAVERDVENRACTVAPEIAFVEQRAEETSVLVDLLEKGQLPERVTHNDTKFNNVMIDDETGKGICVVDLDTVMPGLALYDFGDAVRYAANKVAEDEPYSSKAGIDLEIYDSFSSGFLDSAREFLTPTEMDYLSFSAKLMTLESGMRFLTDYLHGDLYFRTRREGHNLDRCRTQFGMVADMETKFDEMEEIVEKHRRH
jgi:Ser/Thr protein kinase RdoA (MazF antagonist)